MFSVLVVFVELQGTELWGHPRVDDESLPYKTCKTTDNQVSDHDLKNPAMFHQICITFHEIFDGTLGFFHLLFDGIEVAGSKCDGVKWNESNNSLDPFGEASINSFNFI